MEKRKPRKKEIKKNNNQKLINKNLNNYDKKRN